MKTLTMLEFSTDEDFAIAKKWCKRLGYADSYAYCTSSGMPGLYCLPTRPNQSNLAIVKTEEFGFAAIQILED